MLKEEPHQDKLRILGKINDLLQKPFNFPNDLECRIIFSGMKQLKNLLLSSDIQFTTFNELSLN